MRDVLTEMIKTRSSRAALLVIVWGFACVAAWLLWAHVQREMAAASRAELTKRMLDEVHEARRPLVDTMRESNAYDEEIRRHHPPKLGQ